jgi:steroid 5-alpha reductase family enzyme
VQRRTRNATLVDVGWALALGLLAFYYSVNGSGAALRRVLIWCMSGLWAVRLILHLVFNRFLGRPEDARYRSMRERWGKSAQRNFLLYYVGQGILACVMSLPVLFVSANPTAGWHWQEVPAMVLWLTGFSGEATADYQLLRFKRRPENARRTYQEGLWRCSRHPNYFFEWLLWVGFALMALPAPFGWAGLISPLLLLVLIFRVTGIPAAEAQALKTRGQEYHDYQRRTSPFFPWPWPWPPKSPF